MSEFTVSYPDVWLTFATSAITTFRGHTDAMNLATGVLFRDVVYFDCGDGRRISSSMTFVPSIEVGLDENNDMRARKKRGSK